MRGEGAPFGWRAKGVPSPLKLPPSSPKRAFFRRMGSAEARTSPLIRRLPVLQAICLPYGLSLYGKSVFFPQNDRPYGFLYEASQTENISLLGTNCSGDGCREKSVRIPVLLHFPDKARWGRDGGPGGKGNPSRASRGVSLPPNINARQPRGLPPDDLLTRGRPPARLAHGLRRRICCGGTRRHAISRLPMSGRGEELCPCLLMRKR